MSIQTKKHHVNIPGYRSLHIAVLAPLAVVGSLMTIVMTITVALAVVFHVFQTWETSRRLSNCILLASSVTDSNGKRLWYVDASDVGVCGAVVTGAGTPWHE